tara:strand:+ start:101 stop:577 length:477 start_codon:yes stop_codon:yes gene_type:complete
MKKLPLFLFFILSSFVYSQSSYDKYWKDLRSFDEHIENAKELKKYHTTDGYIEMAYLEVLKAIRFNPESSEAYTIKGELNYFKGDHYGAMEDLNRSISLGSKNGCTYLYRALSRIEFPDWHENNSTSKYCADLMTAKALGGCADNQEALDSSFNGNCK